MEKRRRTSRPARGAWIEIHGVEIVDLVLLSRALHGARGLKFVGLDLLAGRALSRPAWGAWIEMSSLRSLVWALVVAPRMGRVD